MTVRHPLPEPPLQVVAIDARGGTFSLTYSGQETQPLAFDATAGEVQAALEALGRIGPGNVAVSGGGGDPFELRFGGDLSGRDIAVVEVEADDLDGTAQVTTQVAAP
jgi:photosystem II stability/assembly factor-like uncharacterized protein